MFKPQSFLEKKRLCLAIQLVIENRNPYNWSEGLSLLQEANRVQNAVMVKLLSTLDKTMTTTL